MAPIPDRYAEFLAALLADRAMTQVQHADPAVAIAAELTYLTVDLRW
jgi:hypothetical protein